ncbi:hypothetical protein A3B42_03345 [Candidatus Daviesbacteria bacterium RIFCSPLOWO2_01_FULL_38_10]|uniref:Uncharacterized protein n=1 Tax=Candidatus Daviesbacteria bacterium GW2011_GWF2_38_6 TaxID=1618432 RepID=A0A0G0KTR9_9BACT|nr:MAG: hypothetical protein US99_C0007G0003 [Candidatus Daviesbacteria bacterium GW2011_GWF2_38_6]OGE27735.1 MAG: hypothetical protein A3D02_01150 [Candidatus Daviesbacteria bacterium RIFCSPHIGHO2_02_FULL_39_41]OGE37057.1 MAG: hypothetical protein A3B42_03345 [Candidatus Daviesbacteria bacterium RIFCSPLOWO2_01_FULL_38_10]OGE43967.1 MAG: hypothetical protein A3E67_00760 [Candidatus Daviesbacteria bacterium RIFCSPHIGHO2_12_FULL_38_25]OGE67164.1 MAG: hypothetical protein A3H81_04850 [Candidatus D
MLIREIIDRYVNQLVKVFSKRSVSPPKLTYLDQLVGAIDLKTNKKTNFAEDIDEIYLQD